MRVKTFSERMAFALLAGGAAILPIHGAAAQVAPSAEDQAVEDRDTQDIIVTAYRREEKLQDVPNAVQAITSEDLQDYNIRNFSDITSLAPGLGFSPTGVTLRGISSNTATQSSPSVAIYLNEVPTSAPVVTHSMYDVGQIEVLRGPQGTQRGEPAPSGAITYNTRRPDYSGFGGYADSTVDTRSLVNVNGGVNIPIVSDVLAIRVAGLYEYNRSNYVTNPAEDLKANVKSWSGRFTLAYRLDDSFEIVAMVQHLDERNQALTAVEGAGLGYNGPAISPRSLRAVQEGYNQTNFNIDFISVNATWNFGGHRIVYVGGHTNFEQDTNQSISDNDTGNAIINFTGPNRLTTGSRLFSNEIRLESTGADNFLDYTLGYYRFDQDQDIFTSVYTGLQPGARGNPASPVTPPSGPLNFRYATIVDLSLPKQTYVDSVFASATLNFTSGTQVRLGARKVWRTDSRDFNLAVRPFFVAVPVPAALPTELCGTVIPDSIPSPNYASTCEVGVIVPPSAATETVKTNPWVYDINLSQRLGDDALVYASYGRSWRPPGSNAGTLLPQRYQFVEDEFSDNYEIGVKAQFFDRTVTLNAALFRQDFDNYIALVPNVPHLVNAGTAAESVQPDQYVFTAPARSEGFDLQLAYQPSRAFSIEANVSYAKGRFNNADVPCRDGNFDGIPDNLPNPTPADFNSRGIDTATCRSSNAIASVPDWTASIQSQYNYTLGDNELFVRGLLTYNPRNDNAQAQVFSIDPFVRANLFLGLRNDRLGLDVSVFARNLFNDRTQISQGSPLQTYSINTGYYAHSYNTPRTFGISARYSFGTR